ncbi:carbohydrate kinase [Micromonospora sp. DR5-3]|uniref:FGGY-family carbohydrate kinase n=1 Tax=unclassified Micromonospora TaxID=2617518 RepID=UPI0011DB6940|nr:MULTISPECIES: FGGY-family carbohydrate kinase [unclassified Micromonospora]MCW3815071.1 carbohydrate kinase [Micromonospora sp. DR5-3]TYC25383.1 carbohydrate kinase [Micromonospora sp. MP36]
MTIPHTCYLGVDVGLTATKVAAFDVVGNELAVVHARTPRTSVTAHRHEVDMTALADTVLALLAEVGGKLAADGYAPAGIGVAAHGNGIYPVDGSLRPIGPAIASSDSRAQHIVQAIPAEGARRLARETGSIPWAAQPAVLLRWLRDAEPASYTATRWVLSCKDWVTAQLTGVASADYSDASAFGMVALDTRAYTPTALELVGLPATDLDRFPPLRRSDEVVAGLSAATAARTGLPEGLPVIAGCMDCVAATLGAGGRELGDGTIIVGTWAINGVVVPAGTPAPEVTLSAFMPDPATMLAMEVAPTSAANLEWLACAGVPHQQTGGVAAAELLQEAAAVPPGADGLLFLPFVNGSPEHPSASGTCLGISSNHRRGHLTRAVIEGVAQYHRVQLDRVLASGADVGDRPWRLAGGGARSTVWAQIFADVLGRPVRRQLTSELGARGVASLLPGALGHDVPPWTVNDEDDLCVHPGPDRAAYLEHARVFDRCLAGMSSVWSEVERYRTASENS